MRARGSKSSAATLPKWCLLLFVLTTSATASAQQLSIRQYRVSEGLANNRVVAIHQDAKGYIWFATNEGLSRFDGYRFVNYSTRDGLGHSIINGIAEDSTGHIWVATNGGGVSRLLDDPYTALRLPKGESTLIGPKFVSYRLADSPASNRVNKVMIDAAGNLWCGTDDGVYRATAGSVSGGEPQFEHIPVDLGVAGTFGAALADKRGRVWFNLGDDLIEIAGNQILRYGTELFKSGASAMAQDERGKLFAANGKEVFEFIEPASPTARGDWQRLPLHLKADDYIMTMTSGDADTLWLGIERGVIKYQNGQQSLYGAAQGLSDEHVRSLCQDRDGNLWIGTWDGGVCKLAGEMIVTFIKPAGLVNHVQQIVEGRDGRIIASLYPGGLVQFVDGKIVPIPRSLRPPFDCIGGRILQDRHGQWWLATDIAHGGGVFRFRERTLQLRRGERLLSEDELGAVYISCIYEDWVGHIWVAASNGNLYLFDPSRRAPPFYERMPMELPPAERLQPAASLGHHLVRLMVCDGAGAFWIGDLYMLAKYANGKVTVLEPTDGLPETDPRAFFIDHRGWLWIGLRYKGVSMTTEPAAEHPSFVNYSTQNGLASDTVWSITEDDAGRIYFGTERGLDRLDLASGHIRHFTTSDGLADDHVNYCMKDRHGYIWVGTTVGVSRLDPRADPVANQAPLVYLSRVQIAGEDLPVAETGTSAMTQIELPASRNNLLIQYTGIDFHDNHSLRYQYELEGVDTDWNAPTDQMAINYARLAPGAYRFLVRAVNEDDIASLEPAVLEFRILPPLWQRWWFIATIAALAGLVAYALYRHRVARLVELERVRTRIAADLHDDIGSSLSQIAVLSEVLRKQLGAQEARVSKNLSLISRVSQEALDSMSDIVWAINPMRDHLSDLVRRMRRIASEVLPARNIAFSFDAPTAGHDMKVGADIRREVYLIFKEAINNITRHSGCTRAEIELNIDGAWLALVVTDNGRGFDPDRVVEGNGLVSLRRRARLFGGETKVSSREGEGTTLTVRIPHSHHSRFRRASQSSGNGAAPKP